MEDYEMIDTDVAIAYDELARAKKRKRRRVDVSEKSPFMSLKQVLELVPMSRSSIYLMIGRKEFPAPIKIGSRAIGFSKKEISEWIDEKLSRK